jgi:hypothetical protein
MAEDGKDVVVVANRAQVEKQRRVALDAQRRRGKKGALKAMTSEIAEHSARRADGLTVRIIVICNVVIEEALDAFRTFQRAQHPYLARIEPVLALSH